MIISSLRPFDDGRGDLGTGMGAIDDFNSILFCQTQSGAGSQLLGFYEGFANQIQLFDHAHIIIHIDLRRS